MKCILNLLFEQGVYITRSREGLEYTSGKLSFLPGDCTLTNLVCSTIQNGLRKPSTDQHSIKNSMQLPCRFFHLE
jgi:hypothetical protein